MTRAALGRRLTAVVAAGAMFAAAAPVASAQRDDSRSGQRVRPPKELLREYPLDEGGRLRSRERRRQGSAPGRARSTPTRAPAADARSDRDWFAVALLLLGATALVVVLVGSIGRRLRRRAHRQPAPAAGLPTRPPEPPVTGHPSPPSGPPGPGGAPRPKNSYAVANQKGGVGKTTVSLVLGAAAARRGKRVLLVDLDPQASATKVLRPDPEAGPGGPSMAEVMAEPAAYSLADAAAPTEWGVDIAPAGRALRTVDAGVPSPEGAVLPGQLDTVGDYDLVLIDCPPSLGALTIDALTAAAHVLVVTEPTFLALQSMDELLDTLAFVTSNHNRSLELAGIVLNRVETTSEHKQGVAQLETDFGDRVWEPHIPRRAVLQDAMRSHVPPQDLPTHFAEEIAELFDSLAERLERSRVES